MDILQQLTSVSEILSRGTTAVTLGTLILGSYIWSRTRSFHTILSRLWAIFSDRKECDDPKIDAFLKSRSALMQFRFMTGIKAPTQSHAHNIIDYANRHRVDTDLIRACGSYFDLSIPALKDEKHIPKDWHLFLQRLICIVLAIMAFAMLMGCLTDDMLVNTNDSGTLFALNAKRAKPLFHANALYFDECSTEHAKLAKKTGFTLREVSDLCKEAPESIAKYVQTELPEQRFIFAYFLGVCLYITIPSLIWLRHGSNARELNKHIKKSNANMARIDPPAESIIFPA